MLIWSAIPDVAILLVAALLLGVTFERVKQSAIVGYLVAGALLGPGALDVIRNEGVVRSLAELGVALLLFTIGLEFSWRRLQSLGAFALGGGLAQIALTGAAAAAASVLLGADLPAGVAFGAIVAPSSTACVLRVLGQRSEIDSVHGRSALGILLLQDVALIPLVLLVTTLGGQGSHGQVLSEIGRQVVMATFLVGVFWLASNYVLPFFFDAVVMARNRELPILLAITACLASSWAASSLGLSPVLGAFAAGLLLGESPYATWVRADVSVLRTLFITLFFTSIGMLGDLRWVVTHWHWLVITVPAVMVGKALIVGIVGLAFRLPLNHALAAGLCLAQTGEFSFVLAEVAERSQIIRPEGFRLAVATTILTLIITPYLVRIAPRVAAWLSDPLVRRFTLLGGKTAGGGWHEPLKDHVVVIGLGPAGQGVLQALRSVAVGVAVVDMNPRTVAALRAEGVRAEVGDATQEVVLEKMHIPEARAVVVTIPDHRTALLAVEQVRAIASHVKIFARVRYHMHAAEFEMSDVEILDEEIETGWQLGSKVVQDLSSDPKAHHGVAPRP